MIILVHVDMDMFFAACEERENPELKGKLFAVGGNSMLSTSNYELGYVSELSIKIIIHYLT